VSNSREFEWNAPIASGRDGGPGDRVEVGSVEVRSDGAVYALAPRRSRSVGADGIQSSGVFVECVGGGGERVASVGEACVHWRDAGDEYNRRFFDQDEYLLALGNPRIGYLAGDIRCAAANCWAHN